MLDILIEKLADIRLTDTDIDAILDMREQEPFDSAWVNAYNEVERLKQENGFSASQIKISDDYRKQAYLKAYSLFQRSDIAAYISDDFGLIADQIIKIIENLPKDEQKAKGIMLTVKAEGEKDGAWNYRMGYSCFYLAQYEEALGYLERSKELGCEWQMTYCQSVNSVFLQLELQ